MEMRPKPSSSSSFRSDNKGEEGILCSANFLNFSRVEKLGGRGGFRRRNSNIIRR